MDTPMGNIAKGMLESGVRLGVSSRGMGSLKENSKGIMEVQKDFRLATAADIVADPSAPNAFVNGIMENVDWIWDERHGWKALQAAEEIQKVVREDYRRLDEQKLLKMMKQYFKSL
jgi:hypothetical protein